MFFSDQIKQDVATFGLLEESVFEGFNYVYS